MTALAFVLELAAVAAIVAVCVSLVATAMAIAIPARIPASIRADLALTLALAPAVATLAVVAATALPPILTALGTGSPDDCFSHDHHGHLCLLHLGAPRPALLTLGSAAIALFAFRAWVALARARRTAKDLAAIERLGRVAPGRFPTIWVPGAARLCVSAGIRARRVIVSSGVEATLSPAELAAALAHEHAHLRRHDPAVSLAVQAAVLFSPPGLAGVLARAHRLASEEACDAEAAQAVGDAATVADALVKVARRDPMPLDAIAFGAAPIETRVRALLALGPRARLLPRQPLLLAASTALIAATVLLLSRATAVHHAVETLLHDLL